MKSKKVRCIGCDKQYSHRFPNRIVCPACGEADYEEIVKHKQESTQQPSAQTVVAITESTEPRLLLG